jgi:restriction endonuclease S subunit
VKLDDKYKTETLICNINIEKIIKQNYSLNYKLYIDTNINLHTNLDNIYIENIFDLIKGTVQSSKINDIENGKYSFITGAEDYKFKKVNNIEDVELINGENVFISHRGNGDFRPVKYYNGICYFSDLMTLLKLKININIKYSYYYLKFNQKFIENNYQKGACNKTLDFTLFNKMKIPVPPIPVQQLIVKELDSMYKQKENLQNAINKMDTFKKARFEMLLLNCSNTKTVKLDDIIIYNTGKRLPNKEEYSNEITKYKYLRVEDVGKNNIDNCKCITKEHYEILKRHEVKENDLVYTKDGTIGKMMFIPKTENKVILSEQVIQIEILDQQKINYNFIHYILLYGIKNKQDESYGITIPHLQLSVFININIILPSLEDQEKIVKQMGQYDNLVEITKITNRINRFNNKRTF